MHCVAPSRNLFNRSRLPGELSPAPVMYVRIPTPLRSYTANASQVQASGATIRAVLDDLNRQFPGICFRVVDEQGDLRPHMRVFVNEDIVKDLDRELLATDEVTLMQGLSGG
jgi:sulfur-carrier protein